VAATRARAARPDELPLGELGAMHAADATLPGAPAPAPPAPAPAAPAPPAPESARRPRPARGRAAPADPDRQLGFEW
jgi:2-oxoglutarate dehydrogenase E2 component (dihydrolipoamide succinyltransferase)